MRLRCLFSLFSFPERSAFGCIRSLFTRFCLCPEETNDTKSIKKKTKTRLFTHNAKIKKKKEESKIAFVCYIIVSSLLRHCWEYCWRLSFCGVFFTGWQRSKRIVLFALLVSASGSSSWAGLWLTLLFLRNSVVIARWRFVHTPQDGTLP